MASMMSQIDTLKSSVALIMDKLESLAKDKDQMKMEHMQFKSQWDCIQKSHVEQLDDKVKQVFNRLARTETDVHQKCNADNVRIVNIDQ